MSDFIQGFTESMAQHAMRTGAYGQDLTGNAGRAAATTLDLNGSWRGPGYIAAAAVGDGWQGGVRPHHARVENRSAGVSNIGSQYDNNISNNVQTVNSVGALTA
ncbi:hypothetical protein [Kribbella sp. CA-293567]|uniref:hypothetical protein n=1 Tax=Kribbella sp. CA-293567 TaxID=3002436 RepID=UPI0022DD2F5C|nr:hypothetical protein [Kribbella sp. CA-293567]WBQ08434.1 hypothetical protein OX958_16840 [Kribbella sp. CA-293567]